MTTPTTTEAPARWRDLLTRAHAPALLVLAGGVALFATNTYLTAAMLPTIVDDIGGLEYYGWATTLYLVMAVVGTMFVPRAQQLGLRRAFQIGFVVFGLGLALAAITPSMGLLLLARAIQGFGGGLLSGLGMAGTRVALPAPLWTLMAAVSSAMWGVGNLLGPLAGGLAAQLGAWRLAYGIMLAFAVIGILLTRGLRDGAGQGRAFIPWISLALVTLAACLFSAPSLLSSTAITLVCFGAGALVLIGFALWDRRTAHSVLPRLTWQASSLLPWLYIGLGALAGLVVLENFISLVAQQASGLAPLAAGFVAAAPSIAWTIAQISSASAPPAWRRTLRGAGPALSLAGVLALLLVQPGGLLGLEGTAGLVAWVISLAAVGAGIGTAMPHLFVAILSISDDDAVAAQATAGAATAQALASMIIAAVLGTLFTIALPDVRAAAWSLSVGLAVVAVVALGAIVATLVLGRRRVP